MFHIFLRPFEIGFRIYCLLLGEVPLMLAGLEISKVGAERITIEKPLVPVRVALQVRREVRVAFDT